MLSVFSLDAHLLLPQPEVLYTSVDSEMKRIFWIGLVSSRESVQKDRSEKGTQFNILLLGPKSEEGIHMPN